MAPLGRHTSKVLIEQAETAINILRERIESLTNMKRVRSPIEAAAQIQWQVEGIICEARQIFGDSENANVLLSAAVVLNRPKYISELAIAQAKEYIDEAINILTEKVKTLQEADPDITTGEIMISDNSSSPEAPINGANRGGGAGAATTPTNKNRKRPSDHHRRETRERTDGPFLDPLKVVYAAINQVPAVRFALGLAGVAAAASIVSKFLGSGSAAIITIVAMLIGMLVLYFVSAIVTGGESQTRLPLPGLVILWAVTVFICAMLFFLTTALAFGWPDNFATTIQVKTSIYAVVTRPSCDPLSSINTLTSFLRGEYRC